MSVSNGQNANQTTFNNSFMSRTQDTDTEGALEVKKTTEAGSGAGALRTLGGLYVAKDFHLVGKHQTIAKLLAGFSIDSAEDNTTNGAEQDVTLAKPFTLFTHNDLESIRNFSYGDTTYCSVVIIKSGLTGPFSLINDAGGTAGNRILTGTGADLQVLPGQAIMLMYDTINSRWQVIGGTGSGSGGGGGIVPQWEELANAPVKDIENNMAVRRFEAGLGQALYWDYRVPDSYVPGSPIAIKIKIYSPDTSGDILIKSQSTLIGAADEVTSTTNQHTSTNTEITMSGSIDNVPQEVELDLADSSGEINTTPVAPGDSIIVRLYRDTDTATSDVRFLYKQCEVTFS